MKYSIVFFIPSFEHICCSTNVHIINKLTTNVLSVITHGKLFLKKIVSSLQHTYYEITYRLIYNLFTILGSADENVSPPYCFS